MTGTPTEPIRTCVRVLEMVAALHRRGYQRLRIEPGLSPSGMAWRCGVTHAGNMDPEHGALCVNSGGPELVIHTSACEDRPFDWDGSAGLDPEALADRFLAEHAALCELGRGSDPEYVEWFGLVLGFARRGGLPVAYDDEWGLDDEPPTRIPLTGDVEGTLPLPPR